MYTAFVRYFRINFNAEVHPLFIDFKKAYDSVRRWSCIIFLSSLLSP